MKELTNEDKARVFAMYLGCECIADEQLEHWHPFDKGEKGLKVAGVVHETVVIQRIAETVKDKYNQCKLLLKPLSEISDEDAIEVIKISVRTGKGDYSQLEYTITESSDECKVVSCMSMLGRVYYNGNVFLHNEDISDFFPIHNHIETTDFLRSRGYALPYKGIDLFGSGIAISNIKKSKDEG